MKRFLTALMMSCFVFCLLSVSAFAASNTYDLGELGMSVDFPDDYVVFTRDIESDDPNLSAYGFTKDWLYSYMVEENMYLDAWDQDNSHEITITAMDTTDEDFNQFSDATIAEFCASLSADFESGGITCLDSEIYRHSQTKFIKIYASMQLHGETIYVLEYLTVYKGKDIAVTFISYSGEVNASKETRLKKVVDSIEFTGELPTQTEAFTYTDTDSGMIFTVPANWIETPLNEEREYVDVKFTSNLEESLCIVFTGMDIYASAELPEEESFFLSRDAVGNDFFTKTDVADMCGCKEDDVSMVTYGGKEYYMAEFVPSGGAVYVPVVYLVRYENGFMYTFQFGHPSSSEYFRDFEALVSSAVYPIFESEEEAASESVWQAFIPAILVSAAATLVAYGAFPLIFARARKKIITKRKYRVLCYCVNILAMAMFIAINGEPSSGGPYLLWTWVFSALGIKTLKRRGVLEGFQLFDFIESSVCDGSEGVDSEHSDGPDANE